MNRNLLIVGAGVYGLVAKEIAEDMGYFEKIDFVDDSSKTTPNGIAVVGTTKDLAELAGRYGNVIVAIGNPTFRLQMLTRIEEETLLQIVSLISPRAYVSPSAQIGRGSIIEPMAVVHTGCILSKGCSKMMFIYGEFDPWSAVMPVAPVKNEALKAKGKGRQTMHLFVEPGGSHRARINTLPEEMKKEAIAILKEWLAE